MKDRMRRHARPMNANDDRLAVLIVDAVLAQRRLWHEVQGIDRRLDRVIAENFPDATLAEITATIAYMRDAIGTERERRRRLR